MAIGVSSFGRDELLLIRRLGVEISKSKHGRAGARPYRRTAHQRLCDTFRTPAALDPELSLMGSACSFDVITNNPGSATSLFEKGLISL
jgi:hypothetical protein